MEYLQAKVIADGLVRELAPFCSKIMIAGSIRRKAAEVKDIEIVLTRIPAKLYEFKLAIDKYRIVKGEAVGRYTQRIIAAGDHSIAVDFFMPRPEDYFRQLAIRTGPAEFSHKALAAGWNKKGWVGTEDGLRLGRECVLCAEKWRLKRSYRDGSIIKPTLPPVWQSEQEFFKWIGIRFLQPEERGLVAV